AEDGIRDRNVTGVQTCALPISKSHNVGKSTGAAEFDGWGTALKPAFEPIVLARKPLAEKTVARNVLAHGTGAINVDACRVETTRSEERRVGKEWRTRGAGEGGG